MAEVALDVQERIWGSGGLRVFISHKADAKALASDLKTGLAQFGAKCFVAHEDIRPTEEWQVEIEAALWTMEAFIALMTQGFHDSYWTDQEVGFAYGRGVPIISIRHGCDPYGFIGKFQALSGGNNWSKVPFEIAKLWIKHPQMLDGYIRTLERCCDFNEANARAQLLPLIQRLTEQQVQMVINAFNTNGQISGSYGFGGHNPKQYGPGLIPHLKRWTGRDYVLTSSDNIVLDER